MLANLMVHSPGLPSSRSNADEGNSNAEQLGPDAGELLGSYVSPETALHADAEREWMREESKGSPDRH